MKIKLKPVLAVDPAVERYRLIAKYIPSGTKTILDVGGHTYFRKNRKWGYDLGPTAQWGVIPFKETKANKPRLLTLNVRYDYNHNRKPDVYYDGVHMPFDTNSFDLVTSVDVFEHIQQKNRLRVLKEILRVAKKRAILVFPFSSRGNHEFERLLLKETKKYGMEQKKSLHEHFLYGLPKVETLANHLNRIGSQYKLLYGSKRDLMQQQYFYQLAVNSFVNKQNKPVIQSLLHLLQNVYFQISVYTSDFNKQNSYRAIFVIDKNFKS